MPALWHADPARAVHEPVLLLLSALPATAPARPVVTGAAGALRLTAWVEGRVQGVGFRWWVRANALELGLAGYAENLADGRVKVVAEGGEGACQELLQRLNGEDSVSWPRRPGRVRHVTHRWARAEGGISGFQER